MAGLPLGAVQNALKKEGKDPEIVNMDREKSYASQVKGGKVQKDAGPPLKDDPEYTKFFKVRLILEWLSILMLLSGVTVVNASFLLTLSRYFLLPDA